MRQITRHQQELWITSHKSIGHKYRQQVPIYIDCNSLVHFLVLEKCMYYAIASIRLLEVSILLGPFTPAQICLAIWSYYLYTLLIKNPKLQPNTQPQMEAPNLPSQPTYRIGSRLARQIRSLHMKRCIEPKKIFIDLFNAKIIQENRPGCSSSLNFF